MSYGGVCCSGRNPWTARLCKAPATSGICWDDVEFSFGSVFRLRSLSKTNIVTRMAINPGIPIPSAISRVSLERSFNGADDGEDEDVGDCMLMVDGVTREDSVVVADDIADEDAKLDKVVVGLKVDADVIMFRS